MFGEHAKPGGRLHDLFSGAPTLVPMPRSAPLVSGVALWPAERVCLAIRDGGVDVRIAPILRRKKAVAKSATAAPGERPKVSIHYESMEAERRLEIGNHLVIVDDVVTKGNTALAAAARLAEAYPKARISLFALIRTKGLVPEIERIIEPVVGTIRLVDDEGDRNP